MWLIRPNIEFSSENFMLARRFDPHAHMIALNLDDRECDIGANPNCFPRPAAENEHDRSLRESSLRGLAHLPRSNMEVPEGPQGMCLNSESAVVSKKVIFSTQVSK